MKPRLLIVILNYLATHVTIDCLQSLSTCPTVLDGKAKVVVWENGSGDEAVVLLRNAIELNKWSHWVELRTSPENLGFTGGNNRVIEREFQAGCPPEYFLLLNSDTLVTDSSLTSLVDFMDNHPQAGIAGSNLLTVTGEHQCSPFRFPSIASEFDRGLKLGIISLLFARWVVPMVVPQSNTQVDWVSGASMILRTKTLQQIGLLDEDYFTYFEDVDICRRAHDTGWEVWYAPQSQVIHLEGASSGIGSGLIKRRPRFWFQARRRFYLKHYGKAGAACIDAAFILGFLLCRLRRLFQNKPDQNPPVILADFLNNCVFKEGFSMPRVKAPKLENLNTQVVSNESY